MLATRHTYSCLLLRVQSLSCFVHAMAVHLRPCDLSGSRLRRRARQWRCVSCRRVSFWGAAPSVCSIRARWHCITCYTARLLVLVFGVCCSLHASCMQWLSTTRRTSRLLIRQPYHWPHVTPACACLPRVEPTSCIVHAMAVHLLPCGLIGSRPCALDDMASLAERHACSCMLVAGGALAYVVHAMVVYLLPCGLPATSARARCTLDGVASLATHPACSYLPAVCGAVIIPCACDGGASPARWNNREKGACPAWSCHGQGLAGALLRLMNRRGLSNCGDSAALVDMTVHTTLLSIRGTPHAMTDCVSHPARVHIWPLHTGASDGRGDRSMHA